MSRSNKQAPDADALAFLRGGGEMGSLIRSMDWSGTSLGPLSGWPQSLRTTLSICLASDLPICVIWGPGLVQLYNDAYRVICGSRHPQSMGQDFSECWKETWPVIGKAHDSALAGDTAFLEAQHIFLERHGFLEECFFTFSFSPIRDETGRVGGLFHPVIETTAQMLAERRTRALRDLTAQTRKAKSLTEVFALSAQALAEYDLDLPFVLIYALGSQGDPARLVAATGLDADTVARLRSACLEDAQAVWPLEEVARSGFAVQVDDVRRRIAGVSGDTDHLLPTDARVIPITPPGAGRPAAILIAAISPRLLMNEAYRSFHDLLAAGMTTSVADVSAYEDERRRAKSLAELDIERLLKADASIRASEERFRAFVSASSDVIYRMSADWIEMRHLQGREFIADTLEPNRNWLLEYIAPEDQPLVMDTIDAAIRCKGVFELEHRVMRVDGTLGWTFSRAIPLLDGNGDIVEWFGAASDVTLRKQTEQALRQSEKKYRMLFESIDEGFCVIEMIFDADSRPVDYRFLEVNRAFEKQSGILGATGRRMREIAPDHESHWFDIYGRVALSGEPIRFVNEATALNDRWFDVYAFRLGNAADRKVAILFKDITARKASEDALRASESRSRTILESITDGFFALDADWRITYMNTAGERFLDRTPGALIGKCLWDEFPGTVGSEFERVYRRVVASRVSESFTAHYPNYDRWYEATAYPAPQGLSVYFRDVTERRRVEHERQQFAAMLEASSDFIGVAGLDQRGVYVNRAGMAMSGLKPEQLASIHVRDFFPESERHRILGFITDSEGGKDVVVDTWFQHLQTGQLIPVSWSFLRLRDNSGKISGYATVTRDLTQRNKAEQLLRESEERQQLALDGAELGMWHVDPATRVTKTDARYRAIFGTTEEWTDYLQAVAVIHPDDQPAVLEAVAAATRLDDPAPYDMEYRIVLRDGSLRWVFAKGRSSIVGEGPTRRVSSFDGTVADITDRKRSEQEREQLVALLREQDQRKDEFLAILAHELRNPLAPIRNGLQIMRLAHGDPVATERVRAMMERQLRQMVHLIDDLLDLSRISRGSIVLRREPIELAQAIHQAIETSRPSIEQAGHALLIDIPPGPIHVNADLTRLAQVFSNLLNNAAKYTQHGGRIRLTVHQLGGEVIVSVKDDGIGIPAHLLPQVFEMFTQVDRNLERSQGGLGIGLSIVKRLVEMHDGSVEARSDGDGRGSEFVVRLLAVAPAFVGPQADDAAEPPRFPSRRRILVVDDNEDAAVSLALLLRAMGNDTEMAHDGLEALELAATFRPDVVLLDIGMPKLDGHEVCRRIRQQAWGAGIVVCALTGWGQEEDRRRSMEAGFDVHLVKPVLPADLEKLLAGVPAANV